jgi:UDP-N-acetylglucosamine 4,6-dehydratase
VELDDMYVVQPVHPWWQAENWAGAKTLPDGFRYASNTNTHWLTVEELQTTAE